MEASVKDHRHKWSCGDICADSPVQDNEGEIGVDSHTTTGTPGKV